MRIHRLSTLWAVLALICLPLVSLGSEPETDRFGRPIHGVDGTPLIYGQQETEALRAGYSEPAPAERIGGAPNETLTATKNALGAQLEWHYVNFGSGIGDAGLVSSTFDGFSPHIVATASVEGFFANRYWYMVIEEFDEFFFVYQSDLYDADIRSLIVADTDGDGFDEIVLGVGNRVEIYDYTAGVVSLETTFITAASRIDGLTIADVDGDSDLEAIFCQDGSALYVYSLIGSEEFSSTSYPCYDVTVAQVDDNADLEIVASRGTLGGWVLNGVTRAEEWNRSGGFGTWVRAADLDGDGRDEIVAGFRWNGITVYDADTQTQGWSHSPSSDIGALRIGDWDDDGQIEVLYGDGQFGSIHALNAATGSSEGTIANPKHGVTDILIADVSESGETEVLWGAGYSSSGSDHLYLYDTYNSVLDIETTDLSGPFYGLGFGNVGGSAEMAFGSFESDAGYGDGRYRQVFADGDFNPVTLGPEPTGNSNFGQQRIAMGTLESTSIVVAADRVGYGKLVAYAGAFPHGELWRTSEFQGYAFQGIQIADVDGDGQPEVIASAGLQAGYSGNGGKIFVFEHTDGFVEWQTELTNGIGDLAYLRVANVDADANLEIVVAEHGGALWVFDGVTHAQELATASLDLTALDTADDDGDGIDEIYFGDDLGGLRELDFNTGTVSSTLGTFGSQINGLQASDMNADGSVDFALVAGGVARIQSGTDSSILWQSGDLGSDAGERDSLLVDNIDNDANLELWVNLGVVGMKVFELNVFSNNQTPTVTMLPWLRRCRKGRSCARLHSSRGPREHPRRRQTGRRRGRVPALSGSRHTTRPTIRSASRPHPGGWPGTNRHPTRH